MDSPARKKNRTTRTLVDDAGEDEGGPTSDSLKDAASFSPNPFSPDLPEFPIRPTPMTSYAADLSHIPTLTPAYHTMPLPADMNFTWTLPPVPFPLPTREERMSRGERTWDELTKGISWGEWKSGKREKWITFSWQSSCVDLPFFLFLNTFIPGVKNSKMMEQKIKNEEKTLDEMRKQIKAREEEIVKIKKKADAQVQLIGELKRKHGSN